MHGNHPNVKRHVYRVQYIARTRHIEFEITVTANADRHDVARACFLGSVLQWKF